MKHPPHLYEAFPLVPHPEGVHTVLNRRDADINNNITFHSPASRYLLTTTHYVDLGGVSVLGHKVDPASVTRRSPGNPALVSLCPHLPALIATSEYNSVLQFNPG